MARAPAYHRVMFAKQESKSESIARRNRTTPAGLPWSSRDSLARRRYRRRRHGRSHRRSRAVCLRKNSHNGRRRQSDDENYEPLQENLARLRAMKISGSAIEVITLPMPKKIMREGLRMPATYANFYIANTCVLVPTFVDPADEAALSVLRECFPNRRIVGIDCRELIWGLGAFHCLTQQQPAVWEGLSVPTVATLRPLLRSSISRWPGFVAAS